MNTCKILIVVLSLILSVPVLAGEPSASRRPDKFKESEITLTGTVAAVDLEAREITLAGMDGQMATIEVPEEVKRLNEIAVGDKLSLTYLTMLWAEFRDPTPEEIAEPLVVLAEAERASLLEDPAGYAGAVVRAVVTVRSISTESGLVTIQGPRGKYLTIPVQDKKLLAELELGEQVVMTYAEAVALEVEKVPAE